MNNSLSIWVGEIQIESQRIELWIIYPNLVMWPVTHPIMWL